MWGRSFAPNSDVDIWLHSDPIKLATVQTDATGQFSTTVTIPKDVAGSHEMRVLGLTGDEVDSEAVFQLDIGNGPASARTAWAVLMMLLTVVLIAAAAVRQLE